MKYMRRNYCMAVNIQRALEDLAKGINSNILPPRHSLKMLIDARNEGKRYFAQGCDKMTNAGRCKGHQAYLT